MDFVDVTLADGVHALDLLLAFPSFRELNESTFELLKESTVNGDELLKAVATLGAFRLFDAWSLANRKVSEAAILDYIFGDYSDSGEVRKLVVSWPDVSKKLLINLVQVCPNGFARCFASFTHSPPTPRA